MTTQSVRPSAGPLQPTSNAHSALLPGAGGSITGGLWQERRRINREVSVPDAWNRLHEAGNYHNLELAAGRAEGAYVNDLPFLDSDVYKWLEAVGWVLADPDLEPELADRLREQVAVTAELLEAAQRPDGYLDSYFQVRFPDERFVQLQWGHELYCAGHLIQAAVALHRTTGEARLLTIARRVADLVVDSFGPEDGKIDGVDGHPEIETALVELYRATGDHRYLQAAQYFVDRRGHGLLGDGRFGRAYWQDHLPVRDAPAVVGHAVRQLYLQAGVADVYAEAGDKTLLAAVERQWNDMVSAKTYLTGGIGAHHSDEAFGDAYELPNERSYCETCAAISSIHLNWRMLTITGEAKYADLLERTLYNGFLAGTSLDGQSYIYANPLQVRDDHLAAGTDHDYRRVPWFHCACCPPNVMRLLGSLEHYVLLGGSRRVVLHQFMTGSFTAPVAGGQAALSVATNYPWDATVTVRIEEGPDEPWELALRVPHWADSPAVTVNGDPMDVNPSDGWLIIERDWLTGDEIVLDLPLDVRFTTGDPRVDAIRGAVAVERGPLVYCLESADHPDRRLDDLVVDTAQLPQPTGGTGTLNGTIVLTGSGRVRGRSNGAWWPYRAAESETSKADDQETVTLTAVPYYAWGNRESGAMRVWLPTS